MTLADPHCQSLNREVDQDSGFSPELAGVSVTMLWALHNRAGEARRHDGVLVDPDCVRIYEAIDYDFTRHFGDPLGSLAARATEIDRVLKGWLERHPEGCVVSLGEGLETQAQRVDNGRMHWLSVDLPDAIRVRERFLPPTGRFRHIAASALDPVWMDAVDPSSGVFVIAQGLLMYLDAESVRELFTGMADRFPGMEVVFDTVPRWFSQLTVLGLNQTAHYRLPPMPWGINRDEIAPTLRGWHPGVIDIEMLSHRVPRGLPRVLADIVTHIPMARHAVPSLVHVAIADAVDPATTMVGRIARKRAVEQKNSPFKSYMDRNVTTMNDDNTTVDAMGGLLAAATQNARCGGDIAVATTRVIGERVALGVAASFNPLQADRAEFSRMVPEKVEAFSTAGMVVLKQSGQAGRHMLRFASDEVMATARATIEMAGCPHPAALIEAQSRFVRAWFARATSSWIAMGQRTLEAQSAAMAPIRQTVVGNAERLGR